jgi:O-Antigen ligase
VVRRLWCITVFCVLTFEYPHLFEGHWSTPWHYVADIILAPVPFVHVWWLDVIIVALLLAARAQPGAARERARPVDVTLWLSIGTIFAWAVYGAMSGGSVLDERLQLHVVVLTSVAAFAQTNILRKPEHFRMLGKAIVYAGLFRFAMMFVFYLAIMRSLKERMEDVTDHGDSVLFVTCIAIVLANAIHRRTRKDVVFGLVVTTFMVWCIQINGRRLAWVGLVGALATVFALMRTGPYRRRLQRWALIGAPILALYLAIGWSMPTGIFKPLASLQSVSDVNNPSTQSRLLEDIGLIITLQGHPFVGTGFGQKYIEVSDVFAPSKVAFPQYRYVPHNSVLGLAAFTGALGFIGIWMVFPVTVFLNARTYAFARTPLEQTIAMVGVCEVIVHINQLWGDIGLNAPQGMIIVSGSIAAASRMSVFTGAWPASRADRQKRQGRVDAVMASEAIADEMTDSPPVGLS